MRVKSYWIGSLLIFNALAGYSLHRKSGALIPIVMKQIGWDPAQSPSIILTTVTDIVGFFSFFGFALLFQDYLISP